MDSIYYELNKMYFPSQIDCDATYHFFYDETNNCRKFWLKDSDGCFNSDYNKDFVLGGVVFEGERPDASLEDFKRLLKLQNNVTELKFKSQFSKKTFLECISQMRMMSFLKWLDNSGLYLHYIRVNHLFYTLADMFDSITNSQETDENGFDYLKSKSVLFKVTRNNVKKLQRVMFEYNYPNIKRSDIRLFGEELLRFFPPRYDQSTCEKFISGCLKRAIDNNEMIFLMDNEDRVMQENFAEFYESRVGMYPHSIHVLDEEKSLEPLLKEDVDVWNPNKSCDYKFENSKADIMIQIADVTVGILGKLFEFTNTHTRAELFSCYKSMNDIQRECMKSLYQLFIKSCRRDSGFIQSVTAIDEISKVEDFLALVTAE